MAQQIGVAKVVQGQMTASGPEGSRGLHQGDHVYKGDTLATAKGSAGSIEFLDKTVLNVGEGSKVSLDQYVFDASKGTGKVLFKLAQGTFRTVTGEIVKSNPESFKMQSPLATIGIRGTETAHTIPGAGDGDGKEDHLVMVFDGKPVIVQPLGGGAFQVLSQAGVKVEVGKFGAGPVLIMTPQEFKYYQALTETGIQQQGAPTDTISTGAGQSQVKDAQDAAKAAQADADAKAAAETAAKAAAAAAAEAAAEAAKAGDPAAKAAAEAAAKAAAELAAKAAVEAKAAAELAAKAAAEAAAALQAQALVAAAQAAAELAAQQQQQQGQFQGTPLDLTQGTIFNINSLMGTTGSGGVGSGPGGPGGPGAPGATGPATAPFDPGVIISQVAQTVIDAVRTITADNSISLTGKSEGQFVDLDPSQSSPLAAPRDVAYYEPESNHPAGSSALVTAVAASIVNVYGSEYNDSISGNNSANIIHGGGGADTIFGRGGDDLIEGGAGQDMIYGGAGNDTIDGGADNDIIYGDSGNDVLSGGLGNDAIFGGIGNDTINGGDGDDQLNGEDGDDVINGGAGNDTIIGGLGNDILTAGTGNDSVQGGDGDDLIYMDVNLTADDTISGGLGADTLYFTDNGLSTDELSRVTGVENITLGDAATAITLDGAGAESLVGSTTSGQYITINGSALTSGHALTFDASEASDSYAFYVTGGAGADLLKGGAGDDHLDGGGGDDTIAPGEGNDLLVGGTGTDTLDYSAFSDDYPVTIGGGVDQAGQASFGFSTQNFSGFEVIKGGDGTDSIELSTWTSAATVYGNANDDYIRGGGGNDTLYGGDGNDTLVGGGGANHLHGDAGTDIVTYSSATGAVTANLSTGSVTANGFGGSDTLYDIEKYVGSNHGDTVTAGSTTTSISCGNGNDTVYMGSFLSSTDTVTGGSGSDTLHFTDNSGSTNDLSNVSGFEHIVFDNTTTNANETLTNTSLIYGAFVHIDGSSIDSGHSLTFDATGLTGGYLYLQGGAGADTLKAANAYSSVGSGEISNRLFGGGGADTLTGATDLGYADLFIYKTQSEGNDTITNFTSGVDKLAFIKDIDGGDFGFNSTAAARSHVYSNLAAYNAATGETGPSWYLNDTNNQLMYDADGHAGVHTAQTMATLTGVSSIATTDVIIVDASYNTIA